MPIYNTYCAADLRFSKRPDLVLGIVTTKQKQNRNQNQPESESTLTQQVCDVPDTLTFQPFGPSGGRTAVTVQA